MDGNRGPVYCRMCRKVLGFTGDDDIFTHSRRISFPKANDIRSGDYCMNCAITALQDEVYNLSGEAKS